jgi:hypothetical protein
MPNSTVPRADGFPAGFIRHLDRAIGGFDNGPAMKLDRMRGLGPWLAFATPVLFALSVLTLAVVTASIHVSGTESSRTVETPAWFDLGVAIWLLLLALMMLSALAVAIDLEWIEHPRTHTGLTYAGLAAMCVATVAFLGILLEGVLNVQVGWLIGATGFLFFGGFGVYLVLMNWVAWRARLLGRVLPWVGIVTGVFFILPAISIFSSAVGVLGIALLPGVVVFLVWSSWLGFKLRGPAPGGATPA